MINLFQSGGSEVTVLSRDDNRKRIITKIRHTPYFYVPGNGDSNSLHGEKLRKIEVKYSGEVIMLRENYDETFESDVLFTKRVLLDKIPKIKKTPIRVCYFDIETANSVDVINTPEPITCISNYDNFLGKYVTFVWRQDQEKKTVKDNHSIYYFNNEKEMIEKWIGYIVSTDPDIFQGWNILGFDWLYIINRCKKLGIDLNKISYNNKISSRSKWNDVEITGRYVFDTMLAYKKMLFKQMDSYSLNTIAREELTDEKVEIEDFEDVWQTDLPKLIERCKKDVELVMKIDMKKGLLDYYNELRIEAHCTWDDLWQTTKIHDMLFLHYANLGNIRLPRNVRNKEKFDAKGALVRDPVPGVHNNVIVLDFKSLYPYIIKTMNISPETLVTDGEIKIKCPKGTYYFASHDKKLGLAAEVVTALLKKRDYYKQKLKETDDKSFWNKQYAVKVLANSVFGAMGYPGFRLYKAECAESILTVGRDINRFVSDKAIEMFSTILLDAGLDGSYENDKDYFIIYGDTDSILLKLPVAWTNEQLTSFGNSASKILSKSCDEFVKRYGCKENLFTLEFEKIYSKIFFSVSRDNKAVKKRYATYDSNGNFDVTGFASIRADTAKIEQETLNNVLKAILDGKTKKDINAIIDNIKHKLQNGEIGFEEFCIRRGVTMGERKDIYVLGAEYGNKNFGCNFVSGSRIKMLFVKKTPEGLPMPARNTIAFEREDQLFAKASKEDWLKCIDWNRTFERLFDTKIDTIFNSMGWKDKQMTLF